MHRVHLGDATTTPPMEQYFSDGIETTRGNTHPLVTGTRPAGVVRSLNLSAQPGTEIKIPDLVQDNDAISAIENL